MRETVRRLHSENHQLRAEKKCVEDFQRDSMRDVRSLLDHMPSLIGSWDKNLRNRFGNRAYANWFGVDPAKMEGMHIREVIGDERYQLNLPYLEAALRGERQSFEREIPSPDGTHIRHSLAEYIPDSVAGEVIGFFVLVSDITSIKDADHAMREAQRLGGVGSFCLNIVTDRWTSSEVLDEIFGIDADYSRTTDGWAQRVHPDERDEMFVCWQSSATHNTRFDREYRIVRASDGALRWVHGIGNFVCNESGVPVQFIGSVQDITERKLNDERLVSEMQALRLTQEALELSQKKLRGLFALSPLGITLCDKSGRFVEVNQAFCDITGYTEAELKKTDFQSITPRVYADEDARYLDTLLEAGAFGPFEKEYLRNDGGSVPVQLNGVRIAASDGELYSWALIEDISERKRKESELIKAKTEAQAANMAKSAFLSAMSHELRTPMNGVMGMAQLLQMPGLAEQKRINFAGAILDAGKTLVALIDDILDISRMETGEFSLQPDRMDPAQLLRDVQALFSESARAKSLSIACDWRGSTAHYLGDSRRLRQMLSNLVSNAIKFTTHGGILIEAEELECDAQTAMLEFSVRDTGVGVAQDKQHLLFQTFSQVDSSTTRNHGGSGLGLSIVRKLAELMNGEVGVESNVGLGSRFWFWVRLERSQ
jgi:PAS domain S-box-containing protein